MPSSRAREADAVARLRQKVADNKIVYGARKVKRHLKDNLLQMVVVVSDFGNTPDVVANRGKRIRLVHICKSHCSWKLSVDYTILHLKMHSFLK